MKNSEIKEAILEAKKKLAGELEELLRYKEAIDIWEELGMHREAKRIRNKVKEEGKVKVDQTVVHGDYVDDRDTIIKDSVVSRSNVSSGGSSRMQELKELKEMLSEGLIDKDDFKEMKKEIMGK
jgi:chromatin segregation and condensation protein Rec8/ScpA/Scc1 (kleisin family)